MNAIFRNSSATLAISLALIAMPAFAQEQAGTETTDDDFHRTGEIVVTAPYFERLDLLAGTSALSGRRSRTASAWPNWRNPAVIARGFSDQFFARCVTPRIARFPR